ncbi:MAG TPA: POTRA domain-containing protein, partial [Acidobacteriota bacterium]|nr:POTRA domain-containing protein [Acidobacteriota bacterium]
MRGFSLYAIAAEQSSDLAVYQDKEIAEIEFLSDGPVTRISEEDLMKLVHLVKGEPFSVSNAEATVKELYSTGLFHDVQVQAETARQDRISVRILLIRKYRVAEISLEGNLELGEQRLQRELTFRQGEPYSDSAVEETISRLIELYQNEGYYQARIEPSFSRNNEKATVDVTLGVEPGERAQVRRLELDIEGNLEESQIRSVMKIRPGGYYSNFQMEEDIDQIETLLSIQGYLRPDVYIRGGAQYDFDTNMVDLVLRIVPREHTEIIFNGIELTTEEKMELPLFSQRGPSQAFLEETASIIRRRLQEDGYLLAQVEIRAPTEGSELDRIVFDVTRGERCRVKAIRFEGNQFAEDGSLAQILQIQTAGFFGRGRLTQELLDRDRESIQFYYQQRGFLDVQVDTQLTTASQDVTVTFLIEEGPRYY